MNVNTWDITTKLGWISALWQGHFCTTETGRNLAYMETSWNKLRHLWYRHTICEYWSTPCICDIIRNRNPFTIQTNNILLHLTASALNLGIIIVYVYKKGHCDWYFLDLVQTSIFLQTMSPSAIAYISSSEFKRFAHQKENIIGRV